MKEIGKIIELLNEWSKTAIKNKCNWTDVYDEDGVYFVNLFDRDMTMEMEDVISKRNGFIKWLVENNKINLYMLDSKAHNTDIIIELYKYENLKDKDSKRLLMLLSISDTPIEDLISYLHE